MYYQTDNNKKGKVIGAISTAAYILMWVLLIVFVSFDMSVDPAEQGILIDFGDTDRAAGQTDIALVSNRVSQQSSTSQSRADERVETQDFEEAPEIETQNNKAEQSTQNTPTQSTENKETTPEPREVNQKALFKGRTEQSGSEGEGNTEGEGNQGHAEGSPQGDHQGTGQSSSGNSFDLRGRSLRGALPLPEYGTEDQGKVIVQIVVSPRGDVSSASFLSAGSTTQNPILVAAALKAAREAKFNVTESSTPQSGTITYIFRMQ